MNISLFYWTAIKNFFPILFYRSEKGRIVYMMINRIYELFLNELFLHNEPEFLKKAGNRFYSHLFLEMHNYEGNGLFIRALRKKCDSEKNMMDFSLKISLFILVANQYMEEAKLPWLRPFIGEIVHQKMCEFICNEDIEECDFEKVDFNFIMGLYEIIQGPANKDIAEYCKIVVYSNYRENPLEHIIDFTHPLIYGPFAKGRFLRRS